MDFFDKIGKKASETYKFTAEKTGKIAKEAKLRVKMNEDKSEVEELYKQVGKKVYEKHLLQDTINIKEELEEECSKIDALSSEIENILNEILGLKDLRQCPNCYDKIDKDAKYCPNCGDKQEVVQDEKEENDDETKEADEPAKEVEVVDNVEEAENVKEPEEIENEKTEEEDD